jgi:GT2 family glycosyltransferase/glycosyltransferase involved in cell wall biosynthesis
LSHTIKVAFASGSESLNSRLVERLRTLYPELPLYVVSEFASEHGQWIPYYPHRSFRENLSRCRAAFRGKRIRLVAVLLVPRLPYRRMRLIALLLSPRGFLAYNENLDNFMLRPRCAVTILRHAAWRIRNFLHFQLNPGGGVYTLFWFLRRPRGWKWPLAYLAAILAGQVACWRKALTPVRLPAPRPWEPIQDGISVVVPSRDGKSLLARLLPDLVRELEEFPSEIIVVDNGSQDSTAEFLGSSYAEVRLELDAQPLSFARAVNCGIRAARYSHTCLLNNDMTLEAGFFAPLRRAFDLVPDLFCATAQILFPPGARRQETGKAAMVPLPDRRRTDFPIRCGFPAPGEDLSYVLYGSGGCSLYATEKLRALGGFSEIYQPAYVEDLDVGYRAWRHGWPSVFSAEARVVHQHRATTSRYFTPQELDRCLEINYLRFLARSVASPRIFRKLWREALFRLARRAADRDEVSLAALSCAWRAPAWVQCESGDALSEELILGLGSGAVAVFPGCRTNGRPRVLVASPYLPFPLSHGGAVRIFNLMKRAAAHYDQILVAFAGDLATPPRELLEICAEITLVRRTGSHLRPRTRRPDIVEEYDSPAFRGALRQSVRKWRPSMAQLEFTQMAQYAPDCAPARIILVEHDITFDLCQQLLRHSDDWDLRQECPRWLAFETAAWKTVDCVVTMSEKDRRMVAGARSACLPNGVDLERFRPAVVEPEPARLLFIGSFAHLPNLLAVEFFLNEVWPCLQPLQPRLHIIAGLRHQYYLTHYKNRARVDLAQPGIEVEDFVADVRPAYQRAAVVIAPLVASAGTNIKIMEAMAMGKAIISTPAGVNGLDLTPDRDVVLAESAAQFAAAIQDLLENPEKRRALEAAAHATVQRDFDWDAIAARQRELYQSLHYLARP